MSPRGLAITALCLAAMAQTSAPFLARPAPSRTHTCGPPSSGWSTGFGAPEPYADVERWKTWRRDVRTAGGAPGPAGRLVFLDVATTNPATGRGASHTWASQRNGDQWTDPRPLDAGPAVRHVANSGMLVDVSGRRFLIDAPIRDGIPPYATSTVADRSLLESARGTYAGVDAILITHWHEDHFSAEAVAAHLANSPRTILVSSPEVIERVRSVAPSLAAAQVRAVLPMPGQSQSVDVGGLTIHVLRIRHNPTRRLPEQHVGFLIGGATPVLHVGDADPKADNFALLAALPPVDLAFLPFWYLSDADNRRMVAEAIRPRRVVAMHVPPGDAAKVGDALRAGAGTAVLASVPGSTIDLGR